jgi:hypothetical protein
MKDTEADSNSSRYSLRHAIAILCVFAASLFTALSNYHTLRGSNAFLKHAALSISGPIAGWILALQNQSIQNALQLLLPTLAITLVLMYFYYRLRNPTIPATRSEGKRPPNPMQGGHPSERSDAGC